MVFVHTRLCEVLENEISGFELFDVCRQLYEIHESFTVRYDIRASRDAIGMDSVRSLIELAVKHCDESGAHLDNEGRDYLLALAIQVIGWDIVWDQFYSGLFRQKVVIDESYDFIPQELSEQYIDAQEDYTKYIAARMRAIEISQDEEVILPNEASHRDSLELKVKASDFSELNNCLVSEVGYSLVDYLQFRDAVLDVAINLDFDVVGLECAQFVSECVVSLGIK